MSNYTQSIWNIEFLFVIATLEKWNFMIEIDRKEWETKCQRSSIFLIYILQMHVYFNWPHFLNLEDRFLTLEDTKAKETEEFCNKLFLNL